MGIAENWSRENLAWAAGLFEGEGSISVKPSTSQLSLSMTDEDVVRKFHLIVGMGNVYGPCIDKRKPYYKPYWRWAVGGSTKTQAVLAAFWSFLGTRRQARATEAIVACSQRSLHGMDKRRCSQGHEFSDCNTYIWNGHRICKTCQRNRSRNSKRKIRGALNEHNDVQRAANSSRKLDRPFGSDQPNP